MSILLVVMPTHGACFRRARPAFAVDGLRRGERSRPTIYAGIGRGAGVGRGLGVAFGRAVGVGLAVAVGVAVGVTLGVAVAVAVAVGVGVGVGVAVGVGDGCPRRPRYRLDPNQPHCLEDRGYRIVYRREKKRPHSTLFDLQKYCDATPVARTTATPSRQRYAASPSTCR